MICLVGAFACRFDARGATGADPIDAAALPDAPIDAAGDPMCQTWSFAPAEVDPCDLPAPEPIDLRDRGTYIIDTDAGELTTPDGDVIALDVLPLSALGAVAISVEDIDIDTDTDVVAIGSRALIIASWGDIQIDGSIGATSRAGAEAGAGANPLACPGNPTGPDVGVSNSNGGGGGGGGGFATVGGEGGDGGGGAGTGGQGGAAQAVPTSLRGGCSGAGGASGNGGAPGGGGSGGGAIMLIARVQMRIRGEVHAGGAGGGGAVAGRSGGGGGGSGGMIKLEASELVVEGRAALAANGGQGGGGCDNGTAERGEDGRIDESAASGGNHEGMGGDGGRGGFIVIPAGQQGQNVNRGAGGGGGAVGHVFYRGHVSASIDSDAALSPVPVAY